VSWLELQLLIKQASQSKTSTLLDNIARATIEVFSAQTERKINAVHSAVQRSLSAVDCGASSHPTEDNVWLIAPLITRLVTTVQVTFPIS